MNNSNLRIMSRSIPISRGIPALILLLAAALAACGPSMRVTHGVDEAADFAAYHTFDWLAAPADVNDPLLEAPDLAFQIKQAAERGLIAKGYTKVDDMPDFYVVFHAALDRHISRAYVDRWGYRYPWQRPRVRQPWDVVVDVYDVGTLVIDAVDARTDELVWRGAATDVVSGDPDRVRAQVAEAVDKLLARFPARFVAEGSD